MLIPRPSVGSVRTLRNSLLFNGLSYLRGVRECGFDRGRLDNAAADKNRPGDPDDAACCSASVRRIVLVGVMMDADPRRPLGDTKRNVAAKSDGDGFRTSGNDDAIAMEEYTSEKRHDRFEKFTFRLADFVSGPKTNAKV